MLKEKTQIKPSATSENNLKKNIQHILNENDHQDLKESLRAAGVNVVDVPKTSVKSAIKEHIANLLTQQEVKNQVLSQETGEALYINADKLVSVITQIVNKQVRIEVRKLLSSKG